MSSAEKPTARDALCLVDEYAERSPTRKEAFIRAAKETGVSVAALRTAAWREGKKEPRHSLKYAFSEKEEKLLELMCVIHDRQGTPLSYSDFIDIASIFAQKDKKRPFSVRFVKGFVRRHSDVLCMKRGKLTSPTRCLRTTREKTLDFISKMNMYMDGNTMNKRNTFVFDETVIGDCCKIPLVIGQRRKSGGGNINVLRIREKALGCYIPFSMPDGSTPFRVFIFKSGSKKKGQVLPQSLRPVEERRLRTHPERLFVQSEKGFLTAELFKIIMEEFIKWWRRFHPGLHCFLISDNLSIHSDNDIVKTAARHYVHMHNIMPGTSHWFQVHDQLPFANLKK